MYVIVLGAGPIGTALVDHALKQKNHVTLIEPDRKRADAIGEGFDARVLNAKITDGAILEEADVERADALIATTDDAMRPT